MYVCVECRVDSVSLAFGVNPRWYAHNAMIDVCMLFSPLKRRVHRRPSCAI